MGYSVSILKALKHEYDREQVRPKLKIRPGTRGQPISKELINSYRSRIENDGMHIIFSGGWCLLSGGEEVKLEIFYEAGIYRVVADRAVPQTYLDCWFDGAEYVMSYNLSRAVGQSLASAGSPATH